MSLFDLAGEVEIIPTDDAIFDETVAAFRDFLLFFFRLHEFTRVADGDGAGKFIGQLNLVELFFNCLSQIYTQRVRGKRGRGAYGKQLFLACLSVREKCIQRLYQTAPKQHCKPLSVDMWHQIL